MAAPTYSWNIIAVSQCDADSPLDEVLMEALRQNQFHLEEWLGDGYTAAKDHDHGGVNSKLAAGLADLVVTEGKIVNSAVALSKIKKTTGSVTFDAAGALYFTVHQYAFGSPLLTSSSDMIGKTFAFNVSMIGSAASLSIRKWWGEISAGGQGTYTVTWDYLY